MGCSKCGQSNSAKSDKNGSNMENSDIPNPFGTEGSLSTFQKLFPKAQDVVWDSVDMSGMSATFNDGTHESEAFFDAKGQFQYLTTTLDFEALPQAIQQFIQKKYTLDDIAVLQKVEDTKDKIYHFELKTDKEYINIDFDLTGKLLKESKAPLSNQELQSEEEEGVEK
jgi:Putative beta-lactamase-inhibitor-like, PepSY-like